jgi:hypothetical protein
MQSLQISLRSFGGIFHSPADCPFDSTLGWLMLEKGRRVEHRGREIWRLWAPGHYARVWFLRVQPIQGTDWKILANDRRLWQDPLFPAQNAFSTEMRIMK